MYIDLCAANKLLHKGLGTVFLFVQSCDSCLFLSGPSCVTLRLCSHEGLFMRVCACTCVHRFVCPGVLFRECVQKRWCVCVRRVMCSRLRAFASRVFCGLQIDNYQQQLKAGSQGQREQRGRERETQREREMDEWRCLKNYEGGEGGESDGKGKGGGGTGGEGSGQQGGMKTWRGHGEGEVDGRGG